ncbi:glycosyltransferase family 10 domain-containing protein [Desulfopila inferna]|uniref:glycosyltransferase family 10 domain-containing protein n=1 Tax=Desulfopila inferna TaxID=468528 RepID=UPI001963F4EA|nr:hypothetical protein [Desulfopila inferna]
MAEKFFSFDNTESQLNGRQTCSPRWNNHSFRVKFLHRGLERGNSAAGLLRQFPGCFPQWGNCLFTFDVDDREYDWLVVYQDLPRSKSFFTEEKLCCPREKTILITGEPSSISIFGTDYLKQFGRILSFQEPWAMRHPNVFFHHPGLIWYYGLPFGEEGRFITWDELSDTAPLRKSRSLSTVCSQRRGEVTLHSARVDFTKALKADIPELDIYGHGVLPMQDKAEAIAPYRFHLVIENHVYQHHLTEKMPDAFLGYALPFYHGAPNGSAYFPKDSFIPIDIGNYRKSLEIIRYHLANNEYQDRLPAIIEARRRVLEEQNLFAILHRLINDTNGKITKTTMGKVIRNRSTMRIKNPVAGIRSLSQKGAIIAYHRFLARKRRKSP